MCERSYVLGAIQNTDEGSKKATLEKVGSMVADAATRGADLLVTQEFFATPFFPIEDDEKHFELVEPIPGYTTNAMAEIARKTKVGLIASVFEKSEIPGVNYDTLVLLDRNGEIRGKYRKSHIPNLKFGSSAALEKYYYYPGNTGFRVFSFEGLKLGMIVCYDRNFPETWRCLSLQGAEAVFVSVSSAGWREEYFTFELRTHAYENGIFAIASNRVGEEGGYRFYGCSVVVNPYGEVINQAGHEDEVVLGTVNPDEMNQARYKLAYLRDRRPDLYGIITDPESIQPAHAAQPWELEAKHNGGGGDAERLVREAVQASERA